MRSRRLSISMLAAVLVCSAALAQGQTADEIAEKYLAAIGGRAALEKLSSRVMTGTISVSTPAGDLTGSVEVYNKGPLKSRQIVKIDASQFGLGQILQDQRFDGTTGYAIDTVNGNREITGDQLEMARNNPFPTPLLKYREIGAKLELQGREKAGERDAYVLRLTPKAGPPMRIFVDAETYLMLKTVVTINVPQIGGDVEQSVNASDYRDVAGVKVPYQIRSINQFQTVSVTATKIEHNTAIDDSMFSKPQ